VKKRWKWQQNKVGDNSLDEQIVSGVGMKQYNIRLPSDYGSLSPSQQVEWLRRIEKSDSAEKTELKVDDEKTLNDAFGDGISKVVPFDNENDDNPIAVAQDRVNKVIPIISDRDELQSIVSGFDDQREKLGRFNTNDNNSMISNKTDPFAVDFDFGEFVAEMESVVDKMEQRTTRAPSLTEFSNLRGHEVSHQVVSGKSFNTDVGPGAARNERTLNEAFEDGGSNLTPSFAEKGDISITVSRHRVNKVIPIISDRDGLQSIVSGFNDEPEKLGRFRNNDNISMTSDKSDPFAVDFGGFVAEMESVVESMEQMSVRKGEKSLIASVPISQAVGHGLHQARRADGNRLSQCTALTDTSSLNEESPHVVSRKSFHRDIRPSVKRNGTIEPATTGTNSEILAKNDEFRAAKLPSPFLRLKSETSMEDKSERIGLFSARSCLDGFGKGRQLSSSNSDSSDDVSSVSSEDISSVSNSDSDSSD
jgi:hypothetical protein